MSDFPSRVLCVGAVVLDSDRALLVRQAPGHSLEGQWSIPWGVIEEGESPADAALRESREEGGVEIKVEGLLGIQDLPVSNWLAVAFLCRHISGDPRADGHETDLARYVTAADLDGLEDPVEPWCEWIVRRVLSGQHRCIPQDPGNPYSPIRGFV